MASPFADYVVSLGLDGRVLCRGSVSDAVTEDKRLAAELVEGVQAIKDDEKNIDQEEPDATAKQADGKLIVAEEIAEGHVGWGSCNPHLLSGSAPGTDLVRKVKLFLGGLGGSHPIVFWIVFVGGLLSCDALITAQTWFMGYWAELYDIYPQEDVSITLYVAGLLFPLLSHFLCSFLGVYGLILLLATVAYSGGTGIYVFGTLRASRSIHAKLIEAVLGTTLRSVLRCQSLSWIDHLLCF